MSIVTDTLAHCLQRRLTFAAFRWNGKVHLWVNSDPALERIAWEELDGSKDVFVVAPFIPHPAECTVLRSDLKFILDDDVDLKALAAARSGRPAAAPITVHWEKEGHTTAVEKVKAEISDRALEKVVLSRTKELPLDPYFIPQLFEQALQEQPEAFVCLFNSPVHGTWLGASPEMLIAAEGEKLRVDAIAGTLPLKAAPENAEDWGEKEREEQELVTRSVLNTFLEDELKGVNVSGPHVLKAAHVAHLHSVVKADLGGRSLSKLVRALHPTPAVCGTPKQKALNAILRYEPHDRALYAGFWGPWKCKGATALYVNIRCARLLSDRALLYLGGGITAGSDVEKEWMETEYKALTWQRPIEALHTRIS